MTKTVKRNLLASILFVSLLLITLAVNTSAASKVKMYAPDGRTIQVVEGSVEDYKAVGWYTHPVTKMFSADGRMVVVAYTAVDEYIQVGWYESTTMYALDGRTVKVSPFKIGDYEKVGWYLRPVVKMYAADGRTLIIAKSHVEEFKKVGWYTEPFKPSQPKPVVSAKPAVKMEDMTSIAGNPSKTDKLTDNYGNKYSRAIYNDATNMEYLLDGKYSRFTGTLYVPHGEKLNGKGHLTIEADGKVLYTSPDLTKVSRPVNVDVSLKGYNHVKVYFSCRFYHGWDYNIHLCLGNASFYPA